MLLVSDDLAGVGGQRPQQIVFLARQADRLPFHRHQPLGQVDLKPVGAHHRLVAAGRADLAQGGAHARHQLAHAEGLGDVVVGAAIEGLHLVALVRSHRQHDDRHGGPFTHAGDHLHAVQVGQTEVEHHQVRLVDRRRPDGGVGVLGLYHGIAVGVEAGLEEPADLRFVVDDQDLGVAGGVVGHGGCLSQGTGASSSKSSGSLPAGTRTGRRTRNTLPWFGPSLSASMVPP